MMPAIGPRMPHRHLIGHATGTASTLDSAGRPRALPDDLLREASQRLGIMALVSATLWVAGPVLGHLAARSMGVATRVDITDAMAAAMALISIALFFYTRVAKRDPRFILDLGLVYMVLVALAISLIFHW